MSTLPQFIRAALQQPANRLPLKLLLPICRQDLFTGLIQAEPGANERLEVLSVVGKTALAYYLTGPTLQRLDPLQSESLIASFGDTLAGAIKLPLYGLQLYKLFSESARGGPEAQVPTQKIVALLPGWQALAESSLVEFHWPGADGLLYVPGEASYSRYSFFMAGERYEEDMFPAIAGWQEPTCASIRHAPDMKTPAWKEYHLHLTFSRLGNVLLARYEKLGGRPLLNALENDITNVALEGGADIRLLGSTLVDRQIVTDASRSAKVYRLVLRTILAHIQAMLGDGMVVTTLKNLSKSAEPFVFKYAREFNLIQTKWLDEVAGAQA